ncbi:MAG: OFA family MFS transporter [Planctomycetes bacterium]|nr:OFA family MFS transporter [Planctomycetota bacterium]
MAFSLSKDHIQAPPGFNRWRVPPAALAIHLCIGQVYAFSVFNLPLTRALGITHSTSADWQLTELGWVFTLAIVSLGLSAAVGGRWVVQAGPRKSGMAAACCWGLGFFVAAAGVTAHNIWLLYLGYGVLGGCGLGIGYITPVSTLIQWFPDRRGMATGLAIMGFGGGALLASPLSEWLMSRFASAESVGVAQTFCVLGAVYLVVMLYGALAFRVPPPGWRPPGWAPPAGSTASSTQSTPSTAADVRPDQAIRTRSFYMLWLVLVVNVTAGIGVLGQASAMSQEIFPDAIDPGRAAYFVGLLSFFNLVGRFAWSSASDKIGRKPTYAIFLGLGAVLYAVVPLTGLLDNAWLFVACFAIIMSMYGGGFAAIPAYLADVFGTQFVGAIHGRLLTAWSTAGVAGPALVNYIRQFQIERGIPRAEAYNVTMLLMAVLLVIGFVCNLLVRPVAARHDAGPA